jgi:hypothetical protein
MFEGCLSTLGRVFVGTSTKKTMPPLDFQNRAPSAERQPQWPAISVTVLVGAMSVWLTWPQVFPGPEPAKQPTLPSLNQPLPSLNQRVAMLRQITDPIERDKRCTQFSAYGRTLDHVLPPDARVFLSGILGKDHGSRLRIFYFLRNYLFPRDVEISLDEKAIFHEWWFEGVPSDSPEELRTKGFDLLLLMPTDSDTIKSIPLTTKGVPR